MIYLNFSLSIFAVLLSGSKFSVDCDNEEPVVFKTPHDPNFTRDTELKMLDVV